MKMTRTRTLLAAALATALLSPMAWAQSENAAGQATQQAQQVPQPPSPPPVDVADPASTASDPQNLEQPMATTPPPHAQSHDKAAAQSAVSQRDVWTELDADGDGRISTTEASGHTDVNTHFSMMDSDGDGFLSADEFRAHERMVQGDDVPPAAPTQSQGADNAAAHSSVVQREVWSRLDTDNDGRISSVEASMDPTFSAQLNAMDADGDGFVTDAEYGAFARTASTPSDDFSTSGDANIDEEGPMRDEVIDEASDETLEEAEQEAVDDRDDG